MKTNHLESYRFSITTLSPVFIGSGRELTKKEYLYQPRGHRAKIIPLHALFSFLKGLHLTEAYMDAIGRDGMDLYTFFKQNRVTDTQLEALDGYWIDAGDAVQDGLAIQGIQLFMKDAYGRPYLPGSSIKGALRTALLAGLLDTFPAKESFARNTCTAVSNPRDGKDFQKTLARQSETLEVRLFHRLPLKQEDKRPDAVNDIMRAISISDSVAVDCEKLVLCRKMDYRPDGVTHTSPNIYRECVGPQVRFDSRLTLDTIYLREAGIDVDVLREALTRFGKIYDECFLQAFKIPKDSDHTPFKKLPLYLGGGVGFVSKTAVYPLLGKKQGTELTAKLLSFQFWDTNKRHHHHNEDVAMGVSPHMLKCTQYKGHVYQMGRCEVKIE